MWLSLRIYLQASWQSRRISPSAPFMNTTHTISCLYGETDPSFLSLFCLEIRLSVIEMLICSSTWTFNRYYITSQARITQAPLLALLALHRIICKTNTTLSYLYVRRNHFHCSEESPVDIHIIHGQADLAFSGARMSSPVGECCIQPRTMTSAKAECDASRACLSS